MVSALYDRAIDISSISINNSNSLIKEHLILEESFRRRLSKAIILRGIVSSGMPISSEDKFENLSSVLSTFTENSFPWLPKKEEPENETTKIDYISENFDEIVDSVLRHYNSET